MSNESLEERIKDMNPSKKSSLWDFLVAAYSSSRAVKLCLTALSEGYNYIGPIAASVGFYLASKTIGLAVKYFGRIIINPFKNYNLKNFIYNNIKVYNPFGPQRRPHFMGATLSGIGYLTGF